MRLPVSKSHAHRVLTAEFLAGRRECLAPCAEDCDDVAATKRCLLALASGSNRLDCGESGPTRRLLGPVAAALGVSAEWVMKGRLASRPQMEYREIRPGVHELPGDVSSQFASGLLFALPLLGEESEIVLTTPLRSRGYVDMTLRVLREYGISVDETGRGFRIPGGQRYAAPAERPRIEGDWSSAAFVLAMNALGSELRFAGGAAESLPSDSPQPDRAVVQILESLSGDGEREVDVDSRPDLFPVLSVVAACRNGATRFTGTRRLRLKESDRVAAMVDVLGGFGVAAEAGENEFAVAGRGGPLAGGTFSSHADHRVAMAVAVGATRAEAQVRIDDTECAAKSYPTFFGDFARLEVVRSRPAQGI